MPDALHQPRRGIGLLNKSGDYLPAQFLARSHLAISTRHNDGHAGLNLPDQPESLVPPITGMVMSNNTAAIFDGFG